MVRLCSQLLAQRNEVDAAGGDSSKLDLPSSAFTNLKAISIRTSAH